MNGLLAYIKAIGSLVKYHLIKYFLYSGLISLLIVAGITSLSYTLGDALGDWLENLYPWEKGSGIIGVISDWSIGITIFVLGMFILKYILIIVVSPIMSIMSESIERQMNENYLAPKFTLSRMVSDLIRSVKINLRNLVKELLITILLLIIGVLPGAGLITTPLIFIIQSYYAGFGILDYWMERHYRTKDSVQYVRARKLDAVGLGAMYLMMLLIPIVGAVIAPVLGASAATIYAVDRDSIEA